MVNDPTKKKKDKSNLDEEYWTDNYFEDTIKKQDTDNAWYMAIASIMGASVVTQSLNPSGSPEAPLFPNHVEIVKDVTGENTKAAYNLNPESLNHVYNEKEISQYQKLAEELKQQGRMEDPRSIENLAIKNAETINDKLGFFGNVEAYKSGELDTYITYQNDSGLTILIPWVTAGDENVCEDCLELEENGPYPPEDYPEPPHFGCRCSPGEPIILMGIDESTDELVILHLIYHK